MLNPVAMTFKAQAAAWQYSCCMAEMMTSGYLRILDQQARLLTHPDWRRAEDFWTRPWFQPAGADLQDHYGKRHLDVDVERI